VSIVGLAAYYCRANTKSSAAAATVAYSAYCGTSLELGAAVGAVVVVSAGLAVVAGGAVGGLVGGTFWLFGGAGVGAFVVTGAAVVGALVVGAAVVGAFVGAAVVGAFVVGAAVVGAAVVGAAVVGAAVVGAAVVGAAVVVAAAGVESAKPGCEMSVVRDGVFPALHTHCGSPSSMPFDTPSPSLSALHSATVHV